MMIENQSISKKEKMDYHPGPDFLSDLPLSIIHIILARVPIREAIRTSLLSRQWRLMYSIEEADVASYSEAPEVRSADFGCELTFTFEKLRFVRMEDVSGFPSEVDFMEFLLESSPVLETMTVVHVSSLGIMKKERLSDKLLGCCWASPNAELLVPFG